MYELLVWASATISLLCKKVPPKIFSLRFISNIRLFYLQLSRVRCPWELVSIKVLPFLEYSHWYSPMFRFSWKEFTAVWTLTDSTMSF